ncbi:hypothetical protein GJ496_000734 [Pomphorhynchus laevis]|nr:hypothetical protein GJ496_000734 [Pomphorhynchus laevis]
MSLFLSAISLLTLFASLFFIIWSFVCGLFYIGEFIEEYQVYSKRIILNGIIAVTILHCILPLFDPKFPKSMVFVGVISDFLYIKVVYSSFPYINVTSMYFIISCALIVIHNMLMLTTLSQQNSRTLVETIGYLLFFIWLIPLIFIVSLSTDEYTLPTKHPGSLSSTMDSQFLPMPDFSNAYIGRPGRSSFTRFFRKCKESVMPTIWSSQQKRQY